MSSRRALTRGLGRAPSAPRRRVLGALVLDWIQIKKLMGRIALSLATNCCLETTCCC